MCQSLISSITFNAHGFGAAEAVTQDVSGNIYVAGVSSVTGHGPVLWLAKFGTTLNMISSVTYSGMPVSSQTLQAGRAVRSLCMLRSRDVLCSRP